MDDQLLRSTVRNPLTAASPTFSSPSLFLPLVYSPPSVTASLSTAGSASASSTAASTSIVANRAAAAENAIAVNFSATHPPSHQHTHHHDLRNRLDCEPEISASGPDPFSHGRECPPHPPGPDENFAHDFYRSFTPAAQTSPHIGRYHQLRTPSPPPSQHPRSVPQLSIPNVMPTPAVSKVGSTFTSRPRYSTKAPPALSDRSTAALPRPSQGQRLPSSQTSVKDLKKRFDSSFSQRPLQLSPQPPQRQSAATNPALLTSIPNGRIPRISTRENLEPVFAPLSSDSNQPADDQSTNPQSFARRLGRASSSSALASPTLSELSATSSQITSPEFSSHAKEAKSPSLIPPPKPASLRPPIAAPHGLLFGEITPDRRDVPTVGYGIDRAHQRRISESSLVPSKNHSTHRDLEPNSPSSWYRDLPAVERSDTQQQPPQQRRSLQLALGPRVRSQSDGTVASPFKTPHASNTGTVSRLPLPSPRKIFGNQNTTSGLEPSPSNSPSHSRRAAPTSKHSRVGSHVTVVISAGDKLPASPQRPQIPPPPALITPTTIGNSRLNAYISCPPPKLSPPLRSSRPRQPVSTATATTTSSRIKAVEKLKAGSATKLPLAATSAATRTDDAASRRHKLSIGPINFAERREHIRSAYTKSIRESQTKEDRQRAAERRKRDLEIADAAQACVAATLAADLSAASGEPAPKPAQPPSIYFLPVEEVDDTAQSIGTGPTITSEDKEAVATLPDSRPLPRPLPHPLLLPDSHAADPEPESFYRTGSPEVPPLGLGTLAGFPPVTAILHYTQEVQPLATTSSHSAASDVTFFDNDPQITSHNAQSERSTQPPAPLVDLPADQLAWTPPSVPELVDGDPPTEYWCAFKRGLELPEVELGAAATFLQADEDNYELPTKQITDTEDLRHQFVPEEAHEDQSETHTSTIYIFDATTPIEPRRSDAPSTWEPQSDPETQIISSPQLVSHNPIAQPDARRTPDLGNASHRSALTTHGRRERESTSLKIVSRPPEFKQEYSKAEQQSERHFTSLPRLVDAVALLGDSDSTEASDNYFKPGIGPVYPRATSHLTNDTAPSLTEPSIRSATGRFSQHSTWTDFSIDVHEHADLSLASSRYANIPSPSPTPQAAPALSLSLHHLLSSSHKPKLATENDAFLSEIDSVDTSTRPVSARSDHQLPELNTGGGFAIPCLADTASSSRGYISAPPEYEPPPIPTPISVSGSFYESRRTSESGYCERSHPIGTLVAGTLRRGGTDESIMLDLSTPRSSLGPQPSADHSPKSFGSHEGFQGGSNAGSLAESAKEVRDDLEAIDREKRRLSHRRMVLKELIATEAVFIRDMSIVEEIYRGTAEACPELDPKTIKLIFRNTDEIIRFHTEFLAQLKEATGLIKPDPVPLTFTGVSPGPDVGEDIDITTTVGPAFDRNIERMKQVHETFLRSSDLASKRLIQIQQESTVKVWLAECYEVAKDLTAAWDLDSLLIKPMQRLTKYPNLLVTLLQYTPQDHADRPALVSAREKLETAILDINKTKKNFELVGQIVGRKRKESEVKAGIARAFGKRVDKLQASSNRPPEDPEYQRVQERFHDDFVRLQVVLRDVEFYTRQITDYVGSFLNYLSSMELIMRLQPGPRPELESKWVQFNVSMRDIGKFSLDHHLSQVRKRVIEPLEHVIKSYGNPSLAMKKRSKRRLDFEKSEQLRKGGKTGDAKLKELVEQYEALNDTLLKELPRLSILTVKIGQICLESWVNIQTSWFAMWNDKVRAVLVGPAPVPELQDIVMTWQSEFAAIQDQVSVIGIINAGYKGRGSQSTTPSVDGTMSKVRSVSSSGQSRSVTSRNCLGLSINVSPAFADQPPSLPTPDFAKRHSAQSLNSPVSPYHYYYRDFYAGANSTNGSPLTPAYHNGLSRPVVGSLPPRPSTGRSHDSSQQYRQSSDSTNPASIRRESNSTYNSNYFRPAEPARSPGLFHSALPGIDGHEDSRRSSRTSSHEQDTAANGLQILWLAASLFEFNIETSKQEAGYPYLTYQAGEIFDVIGEKGELWLAKNQDDPSNVVGWIWSKHFAKLAGS